MWPIPSWLVEMLNGWLALVLPWVIFSAISYLRRRRPLYASFNTFYRMNKMAISLLVLFVGIEIRTVLAMLVRHIGARPEVYSPETVEMVRGFFAAGFTFGAVLMVLGAMCWARVAQDMPLSRPTIWLAGASSLAAAVLFTLYSPI